MVGGGGMPLEATGPTEAISRAQILGQPPKSSPLITPPGPIRLRLFGEQNSKIQYSSKRYNTMKSIT